jgi:hypothetical protein
VSLRDDTDDPVDRGQQPGHGRLAGAGVAGEDEVVAVAVDGQTPLLAQPLDPQQVGEPPDLALDVVEADQLVELCHEVLEGPVVGRVLGRVAVPAGQGMFDAGDAQLLQQALPPGVDGGQLDVGGVVVQRGQGQAQLDAGLHVGETAAGVEVPVGRHERPERRAGVEQPAPGLAEEARLAQLGRAGVLGRGQVAEALDPGAQLLVGEHPVHVDEGPAEQRRLPAPVGHQVGEAGRGLAEGLVHPAPSARTSGVVNRVHRAEAAAS